MSKDKRKELEDAITALEGQRSVLGNAVVNPAIAAMKQQLSELKVSTGIDKQRKIMSILFTDVVNSTNLLGSLDPEESMLIMDSSLKKLSKSVETHSGRVTRYMGDGFLATFGLPIARENDPEMAIQAGLEIIRQAKSLAIDLEREWGLIGFKVRVGINTGLVVTGGETEAEDTLMGNAVNLASRLESSAPPNGILISEYTYNHVRGLFEFKAGDMVQVKGFEQPVQVYEVIKLIPLAKRLRGRGIEGIHTPLIGRNAELNILKQCLSVSTETGEYHVISVVGDAGLGKTRLLRDFQTWLNDTKYSVKFLKARATYEEKEKPFSVYRNLISTCFNIQDDDTLALAYDKMYKGFENVHGTLKDLRLRIYLVGHLIGYNFHDKVNDQPMHDNPKLMQDMALSYLANFFEVQAIQLPLVIAIDDIQWADESTLDSFKKLRRYLENLPITLILLTRSGLFIRRPEFNHGFFDTQIMLSRLSHDQSNQLVRSILHKIDFLQDSFCELIASNADGNPYYIEELIRMLLAEGIIVKTESSWYIKNENLQNIKVPATLTGVVQARLDNLDHDARVVMQQAAIMGRTFWDIILYDINKDNPKLVSDRISQILVQLHSREFIYQRSSSSITSSSEYIFNNTILREVSYASVLKTSRQEYHKLIANWFMQHSGERIDEYSNIIAHHLEQSNQNELAGEYYIRSAKMALAKHALEEADQYFGKIPALISKDDNELLYDTLVNHEFVLQQKGDRIRQQDIHDQMEALAVEIGDLDKQIETSILRGWRSWWISDFNSVNQILEGVLSSLDKISNQKLLHKIMYLNTWRNMTAGQNQEAAKTAQLALSYAKNMGDLKAEANTFNVLGLIHQAEGNFILTIQHLDKFLKISRKRNDLERQITALGNLAIPYLRLGQFDKALSMLEEGKELAESVGDQLVLGTICINMAWTYLLKEEWDKAIQFGTKGLAIKKEMNHIDAIAEALLWLGHAYSALGNYEMAIISYEEALAKRLGVEQMPLAMGVYAGLIRIALKHNNTVELMKYRDEIFSFIDKGNTVEHTWEPLRICLAVYDALAIDNDARMDMIKHNASSIMKKFLAFLPDQMSKDLYINSTPWRRRWSEILDLSS